MTKNYITDQELWDIVSINTHCHHLDDDYYENNEISIHGLMQMTYMPWAGPNFGDTPEGRKLYFSELEANSYFRWWCRGLEKLYGDGRPFTPETWDWYDERVKEAYQKKSHHIDVMKDVCKYDHILLDEYRGAPGSDHGIPELINPVFRIDWLIAGNMMKKPDVIPEGKEELMAGWPSTLDEAIEKMETLIRNMIKKGCVGLKVAAAYFRPLDFKPGTRDLAERAFGNPKATYEEKIGFGDYIMFEAARIAGECGIPVQIHTGLGGLFGTQAINLLPLILANPRTKFDIFHGSYPWCSDVLGLAHNLHNVYINICWLPLISTSRAIAFLEESLDIATTGRIIWGCDTSTSEESCGSRMAMHYCMLKVLNRQIDEGVLSPESARVIARRILRDNAAKLYKIKD